jgi:DNA polymerase-3 subunit delta'
MALRDIIGQDRAVGIVLRTLSRNRVPSAYLFAGESGIGKRFTALNLAKALNCLNPVTHYALSGTGTGEPGNLELHAQGSELSPRRAARGGRTLNSELVDACDECASCRKIDAMTHPDMVIVTPEKGEIRVGEIRAVEEALSLKPFEGKRKVVIVDEADAMNSAAANAFLKTLEEPPDESLLILITAHPDMLPETIRSRCCRLNFVPLASEGCAKVIQKVIAQDKKRGETPDRTLSAMVRLSIGRPGLAISSDLEKERERFIALLENMLHGDNETWADREEMEQWIDMVFIVLRDVLVWKIEEGGRGNSVSPHNVSGDVLLNPDMKDFISKMSKSADIKGIIKAYNTMIFLKRQMGFNLNKAITWNYTASVLKGVMGKG